jgi:hypothetical protein
MADHIGQWRSALGQRNNTDDDFSACILKCSGNIQSDQGFVLNDKDCKAHKGHDIERHVENYLSNEVICTTPLLRFNAPGR